MTDKLIDRKLKVLLIVLLLSSIVGCASAEETPRKCYTPQGTIVCPDQ